MHQHIPNINDTYSVRNESIHLHRMTQGKQVKEVNMLMLLYSLLPI